MSAPQQIGSSTIGPGFPTYVIGEVGINHNGSVDLAKQMIAFAKAVGCNAVKFQKRNPEKCVPEDQRNVPRETPWGLMRYMDYRCRMEFGKDEFLEIAKYCASHEITWFVSCWDTDSVDFIRAFDTPCIKVPSACLTDRELLECLADTGLPLILSTGMSTPEQIEKAVDILTTDNLLLAHCTSTYPCAAEELNLRVIPWLQELYKCPVGYSGHEVGLMASVAAVALGACFVERHITLDRAMWGSDQAASVEPTGMARLIKDIRLIDKALGDGVKRVFDSERRASSRLRVKNTL